MKETPILFSSEMVRAILDGRKTQTRRIINPQPKTIIKDPRNRLPEAFWVDGEKWIKCRYGQPGDRLWVRETWRDRWGMAYANYGTGNAYPIDDVREIEYKAGGNGFFTHGCNLCPDEPTVKWGEWSKWRPSIFMPREAARIFLRVTNVRVERLQDISEDDARAEGVRAYGPNNCSGTSARIAFAELWDSINAKRGYGWDTNPWVWVVKFHRIGGL
jgi:hypothetical protein